MKYGEELILDLNECDISTFTRPKIYEYFKQIAKITNMNLVEEPHFWEDDEAIEEHLNGISAFHFVETSSFTIHAFRLIKSVFIDIFTYKCFSPGYVVVFSENFFKGKVVKWNLFDREY